MDPETGLRARETVFFFGRPTDGMKVWIKFCGGCDPAYDRVEYYQRIKLAAVDFIDWLQLEEQGGEAVLLICGCLKACPEEEFRDVPGLVSVKHDGLSPEHVVAQLLEQGLADEDQDKR